MHERKLSKRCFPRFGFLFPRAYPSLWMNLHTFATKTSRIGTRVPIERAAHRAIPIEPPTSGDSVALARAITASRSLPHIPRRCPADPMAKLSHSGRRLPSLGFRTRPPLVGPPRTVPSPCYDKTSFASLLTCTTN